MEITELTYSKDLTVIQANELIRAERDDLTLLEAKLIALAISQIVKSDTNIRTYSCHISDLADFLGVGKDNIYKEMDDLTSGLLRKVIKLIDKEHPRKRNGQPNYDKFQWCDNAKYNNGVITIRLNEKLKPYLIGLNKLFTQYGYESIIYLPTPYSIRLYELLASFRNTLHPYDPDYINQNPQFPDIPIEKNELLFSIQYLRKYFNCVDKYPQTGDFIKWVIDSSIKGINKNSPSMRLSYRTIKTSRSITHIAFKILIDFESMRY